jgi:hypothetical protein
VLLLLLLLRYCSCAILVLGLGELHSPPSLCHGAEVRSSIRLFSAPPQPPTMAGAKSKGIPEWQRQEDLDSDADSAEDRRQPHAAGDRQDSRTALIARATKFLEDSDIRDASTDKKIAFLKSKGLTDEEAEELLRISRNEAASSAKSSSVEATVCLHP